MGRANAVISVSLYSMANLLIPFECPICGADGFRQVQVKGRDGSVRLTQAYECKGCSTMFRERERFTRHRLGLGAKKAPK